MKQTFQAVARLSGMLMMVMGISMFPSVLLSLFCRELYEAYCLLGIAAACFILGLTLFSSIHSYRRKLRISDGFLIVTFIWFFASFLGSFPYILTGSIPDPIDAFFESASGFSTTGATVVKHLQHVPHGILLWRATTGWLGGLGILLFGIAFMPALGLNAQRLTAVETHAAMETISPKMIETIRMILLIYGSGTILGAVLLSAGSMGLFDALIHSMSAVSTTGFSRYDEGLMHFSSAFVRTVILFLMILNGINYNLYLRVLRNGPRVIRHDTELSWYGGLLLGSTALISLFMIIQHGGLDNKTPSLIFDALFHTGSVMTTTGFVTEDYTLWPQITQMILLLLLFTGACASSTSGGIKVARFAILLKLMRHGISMRLHSNFIETVRLNRQGLSSDTVSAVATVPFLFLVALFSGSFLLTLESIPVSDAFSSCLSCLCNSGCSFVKAGPFDILADFPASAKMTLSILMIGGRLELFSVLVLLTPKYWQQSF